VNKEESLALYAKGCDAWNDWAQGMIAQREALKADGAWVESWLSSAWNEATSDWHEAATADFAGHKFTEDADFKGFLFPSDARFNEAAFSGGVGFDHATFSGRTRFDNATFSGEAWFDMATFSGDARFDNATFSDEAGFERATFSDEAGFYDAIFSGETWFDNATFSGDAWFNNATFKGRTTFDAAKFEDEAKFNAMRGGAGFSLAAVRFRAVPIFIEANFNEAPRLDNLHIEPIYKGNLDLPARWRALKRLAVQSLDHEQALLFFKGELQSRRWAERIFRLGVYWPNPAHFPNLAYPVFSDYGRSVLRPLAWWLAGGVLFGFLYLGQFPTLSEKPYWGIPWAAQEVRPALPGERSCVARLNSPMSAAFELSLRKAMPLFVLDSTENLNRIYACLYGVHEKAVTTAGPLPPAFLSNIPKIVIFMGLAQQFISAVLIFLVLLALRNRFRIK
jgi:hypothetical protein